MVVTLSFVIDSYSDDSERREMRSLHLCYDCEYSILFPLSIYDSIRTDHKLIQEQHQELDLESPHSYFWALSYTATIFLPVIHPTYTSQHGIPITIQNPIMVRRTYGFFTPSLAIGTTRYRFGD
jgi:hypothetical protein